MLQHFYQAEQLSSAYDNMMQLALYGTAPPIHVSVHEACGGAPAVL